ncbi:MAG: hypothetical protein ACLTAK_03205 [Bacilli bacterium]
MENKKFAEGYCFTKIFIFFLIGCLIGTYYEEILWFIRYSGLIAKVQFTDLLVQFMELE